MKKNFYYYLGVNPTVDLIIINPFNEVLMIRRSSQSNACPSMLAFPGGFIDSSAPQGEYWKAGLETPKEAAIRELAEETNLILENIDELIPVGEYIGNHRDPRDNELSWSKSYAFVVRINRESFETQKKLIKGMDDADSAEWIGISELQKMELAFDHKKILADALNKICYQSNKKKKAIFLDRDGVINKLVMKEGKGRAPYTLDDLDFFPGVKEACQKIKNSDFLTIVVTNQPDVARGWVLRESVELINNTIRELLPIDDIRICFHTNNDNCLCRKPMPGMIFEAASDWKIDLKRSFMIGDRYGDIAAGVTAGCTTLLVGPGDAQGLFPDPHYKVASLLEAVSIILSL